MKLNFIFLLYVISNGKSEILTSEENEMRKKACGMNVKFSSGYDRKVLNGRRSRITDAPWNVAVEVMNGWPGLCTGSLISPRHVVTARHCFAELDFDGYRWTARRDENVRGCTQGNNDIVVERNFDDMYKVFAGVDCGYRKHCSGRNFTGISIRKLILPETCDDRQLDFDDFAIVELSENLEFSERIRPVCLADDNEQLFDNDSPTRLFGFGLDMAHGVDSAGPLRYETVRTEKCMNEFRKTFCTKSISGKQMACMGDSGGGVVREVNGRITLLGVIFQGVPCDTTTKNEKDQIANVVHYSDDICRFTGVCSKVRERGPETMKSSTAVEKNTRSAAGNSCTSMITLVLLILSDL